MVGRTLGGYRLEEQIGEGGFGKVYRAVHVDMDRVAAVKVARETRFGQMLVSEGKLLAKLSHPNIVDILHMDAQGDPPFVVMEYVDGESLAVRLQRGPLSARQAIELALPLLDALATAHELGILHRDVKPSNILIAVDGTPKLADFGLGRVVAEESLRKSGASVAAATSMRRSQLSHSGSEGAEIVGTIAYMSPEQMDGQSIDARSDLYSLGVVLYEAVTGKLPVGRFKLPGQLFAGVPEQLDALLDALLAPEPADRPSSAQEARAVLANHRRPARPAAPRLSGDAVTIERGDLADHSPTRAGHTPGQVWSPVQANAPSARSRAPAAGTGSGRGRSEVAGTGMRWEWLRTWLAAVAVAAVVVVGLGGLVLALALSGGNDGVPSGPGHASPELPVAAIAGGDAVPSGLGHASSEPPVAASGGNDEVPSEPGYATSEPSAVGSAGGDATSSGPGYASWEPPGMGSAAGDEIVGPHGGTLVWVPAGSFMMGSEGYDDEKPVHRVELDGFWIGKTEVTVGEWRSVMGSVPGESNDQGDDHPVVNVSWHDCQEFCGRTGLALPTEAQWEYAARGPESRVYPWGDKCTAKKCCCFENQGPAGRTYPVGSFPSGVSWCGAYDMAGNVSEWCSDWYADDYYQNSAARNPRGPSSGECRVSRDATYLRYAETCYSALRGYYKPGNAWYCHGFRVLRS